MFYRTMQINEYRPIDPNEKRAGWTQAALLEALDSRFDFANKISRDFAAHVFWECVLAKVREPKGAIKHHWVCPGSLYFGQNAYDAGYVWDTAFMLDVLSWLPGTEELVREIFENYWEWQEYQSLNMPEYARGMITGLRFTQQTVSTTQNPLMSWAVLRCYEHSGDISLVNRALPHLQAHQDWLWNERAVDKSGLCVLGDYKGRVQGARDEQGYDWSCDMDNLELMPHPDRPQGPAHYGTIWTVGYTSYMIASERCLEQLSASVNDVKAAEHHKKLREKACAALQDRLWNSTRGTFCCKHVTTNAVVDTVAIGSWMPLYARAATNAQAEQMAQVLSTPEWMTPLPMPTVGRTDPKWEPGAMGYLPEAPRHVDHLGQAYNFWRGDVWPPTSYHVAFGLKQYGYNALAARIADAMVMNCIRYGDVNERFDCDTGKPLGVPNLGMSACVFAMMTDCITQRFGVTLKKRK